MKDSLHEKPLFGTVAILGVGLIGGSIGLALKRKGLAHKVIGCARREKTIQSALTVGAIDEGTLDSCHAVATADLVVIGTPVGDIVATLEKVLPCLQEGSLVTDVGSTKGDIVAAAESLLLKEGRELHFVGGHPLAGSEKSGPASARADLFQEATWAITPSSSSSDAAVSRLIQMVESIGAVPLVLDPDTHDAIVAYTSHLPHLVSSALVNAIHAGSGHQSVTPLLAASGFRDTTRLAESSWNVWRDICMTNRRNILAALRSMKHQLENLEAFLQAENEADLIAWLKQAAEKRPELARRGAAR
ncbi:MAG: prephenate dehydrogenase [Armatimonadetes bacterium]|nr:prephenate dehydrogenase [Armatimonadota bacterium]